MSAPSRGTAPAAVRGSAWLFFWAALLVQLVALYWPRTPSEGGALGFDKVVHFALFLAVVVTAVRAGLPRVPVFVVCALHAPGSELIQHYVLPHRDGDWTDAVADLAGVLAGVLIVTFTNRRAG